ncbi:hypothetical protein Gotur_007232 [Gossypium turneri]
MSISDWITSWRFTSGFYRPIGLEASQAQAFTFLVETNVLGLTWDLLNGLVG